MHSKFKASLDYRKCCIKKKKVHCINGSPFIDAYKVELHRQGTVQLLLPLGKNAAPIVNPKSTRWSETQPTPSEP